MKVKYILVAGLAAVSLMAAGCSKQAAQNTDQSKTNEQMMQDKKEAMAKDEHMDKMSDNEILGIYKKDGKLLTIWPGNDLVMLEKDVTLKTGIKVSLAGNITAADGKVITLKEGQVLNLDGSITEAKKELMQAKVMVQEGEMMKDQSSMKKESEMTKKEGSYKDYSAETVAAEQKAGQKVVIFFHAQWCPYCKAADAAFKANAGKIPAGVTVLKADYDSQTELKQKYGVTHQHTFVQIDNSGNLVTKWVSGDIDMLIQNIK